MAASCSSTRGVTGGPSLLGATGRPPSE
jgi:hypothetical protein